MNYWQSFAPTLDTCVSENSYTPPDFFVYDVDADELAELLFPED